MAEMPADRWLRVEQLYNEAVDRDAAAREAYLDDACAGDAELRAEVASLLRFGVATGGFLDRPALADAAKGLAQDGEAPPPRVAGYEVLSLLGAGGMGLVYCARDVRLGREVALKVLARSIASDPAYRHRFEEEARAASGLNHPNIVTIYGVGDADGIPFIAMELVQGRTLRAVLASGPLAVAAALEIAAPLADALSAAHAAGIVHRDLKPENVMVTPDGLIKVLDFGIAKRARGLAPEPVGGGRAVLRADVTQPGSILGTAGYMSPEQASGRMAGHQSDQFAFGAILYEMLSGHRAFDRPTGAETVSAILHEEPDPIPAGVPGLTAPLRAVIDRCLAKDPAGRYADTRELARELRRIRDERAGPGTATGVTRRRVLWLGGAVAASVAAGAASWRLWLRDSGIRSLAVLPFVDLTKDEDAEYLSDGMTEGLIHRISQMPSLTVMARSLVFNFKGKAADPRAVGRQLGVDAVLTGNLARRSGRLIVSAELVDVASGAQLWGTTYDRPAADALLVQDEIVRAVVETGMHLRLAEQDRRRLARRPTDDVDAYELYLRAVHRFESGAEDDYLAARDLLGQALAKDPSFALAYAALATTYAVMAVDGFARPGDAWPESSRNVQQALARDPDLPDAHAAAASIAFFFEWDWARADREWNLALRSRGGDIDPTFLMAYALQQWALGRLDAARDLAHRARLMDPLSPAFVAREADFCFQARRLDDAAGLYEKAIRDAPDDPRAYFGLADTRYEQGRFDEAIDARRRGHVLAGDTKLRDVLSAARGAEGYRQIEHATAEVQIASLDARAASGGYVSPLDYARSWAVIGDRGHAMKYLADAFKDRSPGLVFLKVDPAWNAVRDDPAFRAAERRIGLP
jgi:eukaryotic-like serine/threonine-protein kinase